jgi:hypothetical protein
MTSLVRATRSRLGLGRYITPRGTDRGGRPTTGLPVAVNDRPHASAPSGPRFASDRACRTGYPSLVADPKTEELRIEQVERVRSERAQADDAADRNEELTHQRRAERAAYLKKKLDERAKSEEERQ